MRLFSRCKSSRFGSSKANPITYQTGSKDQLTAAATLERAIMPNGQRYEDWREDKKGRGEDGENLGPS